MALAPGTRLGPYEIVAPLGAGGMGEVYRARDPRLGRDVAIKALPAAFAADAERLARFRREAQTLAALNHANIAAIYGLEETGQAPHLVLELVEGESLAARLARGPLPPREALALGIQIAGAIEAAHERGIVHRDLKPGNVMITASGVDKVLDFGLAKSERGVAVGGELSQSPTLPAPARSTVAGVILGTVAYMSPEQARGKPVDRRSDVWSFGCVLFECFAGRPAFAGDTVSDLIARILEREPEWAALPAGVPSRAREILRRCLRKDADERPRDMRDVRLELAEVAAGGERAAAGREKSIAVLPFENLSGADDEYFADGVTDEILNALASAQGLRVAARASCFAFKGRREDLLAIGERLDVTTVLEGTVRRAGSRLRITVQLANAADGYQLWSERYDREMTDVFAVQDEIAGAIVTRLRGAMHAEADRARARGGTKNLEAYELLLRGRALQTKRGRFISQAVACFERAIALDPQYPEALALLSDSYQLMGVFGLAAPVEVMPRAKSLAERALAIDSGLAEAWTTLAAVEERYERNFARADSLYERALAVDPRHSVARARRGLWGLVRGALSVEQAMAEVSHAIQDDPLNSWLGGMHSYVLGIAGRQEESIAEAERSRSLDPDSFFPHWNMMRGYAWAGHYDRAIAEAPALFEASGRHAWALGLLAGTYGRAGRADRARAVYDELEARSRHEFVSPTWLAIAAGSAGLEEPSIRWCSGPAACRSGTPCAPTRGSRKSCRGCGDDAHPRHPPRPLRDHRPARRRRHGRSVPRSGRAARARRGGQGAARQPVEPS
jgi:serine/threonine-protein kinase